MINSLFQVNRLNEDGMKKADEIAFQFDALYTKLAKLCPTEGREISIVKTKLEEACFYAKKSVALNVKNQQKGT